MADNDTATIEDVERAIKAVRDYTDGKFAVLDERLDGIDKATIVLSDTANRTPTDIQKAVGGLREVLTERFKAVDKQFAASKEAVDKAENATDKRFEDIDKRSTLLTEQVRQLMGRAEYNVAHQAIVDKVDTLTTRFERNEGTGAGLKMGWGILVAGVGMLAAIIAILTR